MTWAIWGGNPFRIASVMNSLRKSCGVNRNGPPVAGSVRPVSASAAVSMARMLPCGDRSVLVADLALE